eukprot:m.198654 g.198654  ORF g.198654 m.198654 type:complete len:320 (-) comp21882_c1_seq4:31-990(-)
MIRAGLDVGSGSCKMVVARMNADGTAVEAELHAEYVECLVAHDYKSRDDGTLSMEIVAKLLGILAGFRAKANSIGGDGVQMKGVATQIFRIAKNGQDVLQRIAHESNIHISVIPQSQEGELGFLTGAALAPETARTDLVVWDSGGASFQLSATAGSGKEPLVFQGALGSSIVTADMVNLVQGRQFRDNPSPNPVSRDQAQRLAQHLQPLVGAPPEWLTRQLQNEGVVVVGIGEQTSVFYIGQLATGKAAYTSAEVRAAMDSLYGLSDEQLARFPQPTMVLPKLVLLHTVMEVLGMRTVLCRLSTGICQGVLLHSQFWQP